MLFLQGIPVLAAALAALFTFTTPLRANTPQAPMHLGRIWVHPEYDGAEGWGGSAPIYPAGIATGPDDDRGASIKRGWLGQGTKLGVYLSTTDWTSPLGTSLEYASSYCFRSMDYTYPREYSTDIGNYDFPVGIQEVFRWPRPTIVVGDRTLSFFPGPGAVVYPDNAGVGPRPDPVIDPNLVTEQAIDCVWRYSQGVESRRRQYGYGFGTAHQDYVVWDATLVNNGKSYGDIVPTDPKFTLTNQTIHKMIFGQAYDYTNAQAPTPALQTSMDNEAMYVQPWGPTGNTVVLFHDLDSQHASAPGPDWGDPIETAWMEGHLAGNAYIGFGALFASRGPGALFGTNDPDQPAFRTFQQMRGLDFAGGGYPANSRELREFLTDGALEMPMNMSYRSLAAPQPQDLRDDSNGPTAVMGYGPLGGDKKLTVANVKAHGWDLAWMDSVRIVQVIAGGGIDAYEGQRIGQYWNAQKAASAAPSTWMTLEDQALVQTGRDTLNKALALAYWNFNGTMPPNVAGADLAAWGIPHYVTAKPAAFNQPYNVPDAPRPPGYFRAKALHQVCVWGGTKLRWTREAESAPDFDTGVNDFMGYRIYRWEGSRLVKPVVIAEGPSDSFWSVPAEDGDPAGLAFVDRTAHMAVPYWYAVTAYDDGTQNWAEPGKSLESSIFWTWTGFTSEGVTPESIMWEECVSFPVSGTITSRTFYSNLSPYRVTGTVTIPANNTLVIQPGVDVLFDADVQFIVQGRLHAAGTSTDSIRFLPGNVAAWKGIRITGGDSSTIMYARISGGNARDGATASDNWGGGVFVSGAGTRLGMHNSVLSDNVAFAVGGGAYVHDGAMLNMTRCTVSGGHAGYAGAGIGVDSSSALLLTECSITDNSLLQAYGGGIANWGNLSVTECDIFGNKGNYGGGIANVGGGSAIVRSSRIHHNGAYGCGGGVDNSGGTMRMVNCTLDRNFATLGDDWPVGGGASNSGALTLVNCTVYGNRGRGGGIVNKYPTSSVALSNTIIWGNDEPALSSSWFPGVVTATYSDIQGTGVWDGEGNINSDPLFVDPASDDFRLQSGSPCINMGDPTWPFDQDGTRADIGAHRFATTTAVTHPPQPVPFFLAQSFPNPFNPSTTIRFGLPEAGYVRLIVYDVSGRVVRTLADGNMTAGTHGVVWDGRDTNNRVVASGVYIYRLTGTQGVVTKRMTLVR